MNKSINLSKVEYYLYKADCGLRLLLIPNPYATIISYGAYISVGSLDETNEELGVAHFLEHMTFKGTNKRSSDDLMLELDSLGANYNARYIKYLLDKKHNKESVNCFQAIGFIINYKEWWKTKPNYLLKILR
jgi:predicted Zn-dependent peptidase